MGRAFNERVFQSRRFHESTLTLPSRIPQHNPYSNLDHSWQPMGKLRLFIPELEELHREVTTEFLLHPSFDSKHPFLVTWKIINQPSSFHWGNLYKCLVSSVNNTRSWVMNTRERRGVGRVGATMCDRGRGRCSCRCTVACGPGDLADLATLWRSPQPTNHQRGRASVRPLLW